MAIKVVFNKDAKTARAANKKCVIQIMASDHFFIGHCVSFVFLEEELKKTYRRYTSGNGLPPTNMYLPLVKYMSENDIIKVTVECIYEPESDNGYEVLKEESLFLKEHYGKFGCLNKNKEPYIPAKIKSVSHPNAWMTLSEAGNIQKHLNRLWPERER
jgi:hypothetical protein